MNQSMKNLTLAFAAVLALLEGTTARAQPTLDFTVAPSSVAGSIAYSSTSNSPDLVGTGITISQVQGLSTPVNDMVIAAITGGSLYFTSGAYNGTPHMTSWSFGAGPVGGLNIYGSIPTLGIPSSVTLVTGQIESATVVATGSTSRVTASVFLDTINSALASIYGISGGAAPYSGTFNISFTAPATPPAPGSFSSTSVVGGDVYTTPVPVVPEPSTLAIAVLGALGMIGFGLWRKAPAESGTI